MRVRTYIYIRSLMQFGMRSRLNRIACSLRMQFAVHAFRRAGFEPPRIRQRVLRTGSRQYACLDVRGTLGIQNYHRATRVTMM